MARAIRLVPVACCLAASFVLASCAARRPQLPTDSGTVLPNAAEIHAVVSAACRGVRTMTVELALSGRAADQRLRGRLLAGFERPASMRLEGVAPFGPPAFILAARDADAVLLLPREDRVLRSARAQDILEALTGVALAPADLQAILAGCVVPDPAAAGGRMHQNGWASLDLQGDATLFLARAGTGWQVRAARRGGWQIEYPEWRGTFPHTVRLLSTGDAAVRVDLTAVLSGVEANVPLDAAAFTIEVPAGADAMTLEELRAAGPLRGTTR